MSKKGKRIYFKKFPKYSKIKQFYITIGVIIVIIACVWEF